MDDELLSQAPSSVGHVQTWQSLSPSARLACAASATPRALDPSPLLGADEDDQYGMEGRGPRISTTKCGTPRQTPRSKCRS